MESTLTLRGKVALVTGATRGIGWATARLLAEQGAAVLLNGTNAALLGERAEHLKSTYGTETEVFAHDVADPEAIKATYAAIFKRFKRLDILVNNAGIMEDGLLAMVTPQGIDKTFHVNVNGVLLNMQYASRLMARNEGGSIINISSIMGTRGNAGQIVYSASKAAVIGITLSAAKELAPKIRVNAITPGLIQTDLVRNLSPQKLEERVRAIKLGRPGEAAEVAKAVLFFASDLSSYVTGQVLGVDGGMVI
jgi:3-oxoacyl-[acyl-carrier protein] reductase